MSNTSYGYALEELGTLLPDYPRLQECYNARIHAIDYGAFADSWERSLYSPIRAFVTDELSSVGEWGDLLYCAPGAHAPLLAETEFPSLARCFRRIALVDIDRRALNAAAALIGRFNPATEIETHVFDFSGEFGQRLSDIYADALEVTEARMVAERLITRRTLVRNVFDTGTLPSAAGEWTVNKGAPCAVVSEMMAAFTGTPALLAFRSELFRRFGSGEDEASVAAALQRAGALWQSFNDGFLESHLEFLRSLIGANDEIILVLDTDKVFEDPHRECINSFSGAHSLDEAIYKAQLRVRREATTAWNDHPIDLETLVHGRPVDDFKAHRHTVRMIGLTLTQ